MPANIEPEAYLRQIQPDYASPAQGIYEIFLGRNGFYREMIEPLLEGDPLRRELKIQHWETIHKLRRPIEQLLFDDADYINGELEDPLNISAERAKNRHIVKTLIGNAVATNFARGRIESLRIEFEAQTTADITEPYAKNRVRIAYLNPDDKTEAVILATDVSDLLPAYKEAFNQPEATIEDVVRLVRYTRPIYDHSLETTAYVKGRNLLHTNAEFWQTQGSEKRYFALEIERHFVYLAKIWHRSKLRGEPSPVDIYLQRTDRTMNMVVRLTHSNQKPITVKLFPQTRGVYSQRVDDTLTTIFKQFPLREEPPEDQ